MNSKIIPNELDGLASAPQGLDGQYVPLKYLQKKKPLSELQKDLEKEIRLEYFRSLIYSPQVIINRAYLFNTPPIYKDFVPDSPNRNTFLNFLENKWIIPWLYKETTLEEKPNFSIDPIGWEAVSSIIGEANIPYLRLSWDESENIRKVNRLSKEYTGYIMRMAMVAEPIAYSLGIKNKETIRSFSKKLIDVGKYCYEIFDKKNRKFITRDDLYKKYICFDGTKTVDGIYDYEKEFVKELKMVFDLKYNVNLPDSLGIQTLTGVDLPDRSALQEINLIIATTDSKNYDIDLSSLFSNIILSRLSTEMWVDSINSLSLKNIHDIRETPEFQKFILEMRNLRKEANNAIVNKGNLESLNNFALSFIEYQKVIASCSEKKRIEEIQPSIEIAVKIGGIILSIIPGSKILSVLGASISGFDAKLSEFSATIIVKGRNNHNVHDASISCDLFNSSLNEPKNQILKLIDHLKKNGYSIDYKKKWEKDNGTLEEPSSDYELPDYQ